MTPFGKNVRIETYKGGLQHTIFHLEINDNCSQVSNKWLTMVMMKKIKFQMLWRCLGNFANDGSSEALVNKIVKWRILLKAWACRIWN